MKILGMEIPALAVGAIVIIFLLIAAGAIVMVPQVQQAFLWSVSNSPYLLFAAMLVITIYVLKFRGQITQDWAEYEEAAQKFYGIPKEGANGGVRFGKSYEETKYGRYAAHGVQLPNRGLWAMVGDVGSMPKLGTIFMQGIKPRHGSYVSGTRYMLDYKDIAKIDNEKIPIDVSIQRAVQEKLKGNIEEAVEETLG
jgi:hypothetical protein